MRKLIALAASAACLAAPFPVAMAATVELDSISFDGTEYTFFYGGTLAPSEGVVSGSQLVILDFKGYVSGSVFSPYPFITASTEFTSAGILTLPGTDDPTIENLVFTYTGAPFQVDPAPLGSPYSPIDFSGLSAKTTLGALGLDGFGTTTMKNTDVPASIVYSVGTVAVPAAIPEPATWGLMMLGFGAVGMAARRRHRQSVSFV